MEKVVLFGAGDFGKRMCRYLTRKGIMPVCFVDNNKSRWGNMIYDVEICPPDVLDKYTYDIVAICVNDMLYNAIYEQLRDEFRVNTDCIKHWTYWQRNDFLDFYEKKENVPQDAENIIDRVKSADRLYAFNDYFVDEYKKVSECFFDDECKLFYTIYQGKRLYLSNKFNTKIQAEHYIDSLLIEQDIRSPHCYVDDFFSYDGNCLLDAGAAEGIFALTYIEKVDHVVLVEVDSSWNEALTKTFEKWTDKVTIINKFLADEDVDEKVTIDSLAMNYKFDFVKMDIEGAELDAIKGGIEYLTTASKLKMAICVYHNNDDEHNIAELVSGMNFNISTTNGYMVFPDNVDQEPRLVHGIMRLEKI